MFDSFIASLALPSDFGSFCRRELPDGILGVRAYVDLEVANVGPMISSEDFPCFVNDALDDTVRIVGASVEPQSPLRGALPAGWDPEPKPFMRLQGAAVMHVHEELAQHRGQTEVSREVILVSS